MTTSPWTFAEESQAIPAGHVTLVRGTTFAIFDPAGDLTSQGVQGLFVADTRVCSRAQLTIDAGGIEPLAVAQLDPGTAAFGGRSADESLFVRRTWTLGSGARCDIELWDRSRASRWVDVGLGLGSDLADVFSVKDGHPDRLGQTTVRTSDADEVRIHDVEDRRGFVARVVDIAEAEPLETEDGFAWRARLDDDGRWRCSIELAGTRAGVEVRTSPNRTWRSVRHRIRVSVDTDVPGLARSIDRTIEDLDALRLVDPEHPDDEVVAAGAPWFMTLFGRDSLLTSWMALPVDPELGLATARTLARLQGRRFDAATEEQPGRILHEVRFGAGPSLSLAESERYYATADATPLFVMLVHELWRWGTPWADIAPLLPAVHAAVDWLSGPGDPDGDGFVEYERATEHGLLNQGWKDSWDAISSVDGTLADPPIALAEVQAYAYAALQAAGELAAAAGDHDRAKRHSERAGWLRQAFDEAFWLPEHGWYALALDADKRPVDALASNLGHLLWCGVVPPERVRPVAEALVSEPMLNGWGVRTLASTMGRYDPLGYHTGSVWPHDTAIAVAGLRRAGRPAEAAALAMALLEAADAMGGRLPELFAGLGRDEFPAPVPYPASCSPQAWASAAPLLLLRSLLGLEVDVPGNRICLDPQLPEGSTRLRIAGLCLAGNDVTIQVDRDDVAFHGLPHGMAVELV